MHDCHCVWCGALSEAHEQLCPECDALYEADRVLPLNKHEDWIAVPSAAPAPTRR